MRFIKLNDVISQTGLSKSTIYQKISENKFPAPIKLSERASGWLESDIQAWIAQQIPTSHIHWGGASHA